MQRQKLSIYFLDLETDPYITNLRLFTSYCGLLPSQVEPEMKRPNTRRSKPTHPSTPFSGTEILNDWKRAANARPDLELGVGREPALLVLVITNRCDAMHNTGYRNKRKPECDINTASVQHSSEPLTAARR